MTSAQTIPLKHLAGINECSLADDTHPDKVIRYIDIGAVGRGKLISRPESLHFKDAPLRARRIVREGDTIVSTVRTYLRAVWPVTGDVANLIVSTGFAVITPRQVEPRYLSWWLTADPFVEEVAARSVGVSYPAINASELGQLPVRFPALAEQRAIADYLDAETVRIDTLISKKRRLLDLLAEYRTALITQTVTRGLDPSPRLRPSGIDWLGDIPEHWKLQRLGRIGSFFKGGGGTKQDETEQGVPCVRYGDLYTHHQFFIRDTRAHIAETSTSNYRPLRYGDVLFAGSGETLDEIGASAVNLIKGRAFCGGDVIVFRPSVEIHANFLGYAADCQSSVYQKACMGRGVTVMHIYSNELKDLLIPVPPIAEQRAIADYLDTETTRIDALSSRTENAIKLLEEYRASLITAAVTGGVSLA